MIDPIKLNKFNINKEVASSCRQGKLIDKDSVLYHMWRIFWVTPDIVDRIKVIRVKNSDLSSLYTIGSLHPIESDEVGHRELKEKIQNLDRSLYDYVVIVQEGVLIKHFMDFWIHVNYQIHLLNENNKNISGNFEDPACILKLNDENHYEKSIALSPALLELLIPANDLNSAHIFIERYREYSYQRVYLLNNDDMEIQPVNITPQSLFCVSSGLKPARLFSQMRNSLEKITFCDYSSLALDFWREFTAKKSVNEVLSLFDKFSPNFIGKSDNAKAASRMVFENQIQNYFEDSNHFFSILNEIEEKADFLKVDIITNLDFLNDEKNPYYFWFSNSYERNLTLLTQTKEQHRNQHLERLKRFKNNQREKVFYNEDNYDFRLKSSEMPYALGTHDEISKASVKWIEL